jgi:hypothetical protein
LPRAGREGLEGATPQVAQKDFGKDRAGRVARADETHVEIGIAVRCRHRISVLVSGKQRSKKIRPAAANIEREIADEGLSRVEVDRIMERTPTPRHADKTRGSQVGQVVRERVLLQTKRGSDLGRPHTLRREPHEKAKDRKSARVTQDRTGVGGAIPFHISQLPEM